MINDDETDIIDPHRSVHLYDVGAADYAAATCVSADGSGHLVLVHRDALNDPDVRYDPHCADIAHEQLGPLPIDCLRRLTISFRRRCR
ncbi:hypothetical protein AWC11_11370 [Mycobacterium interjectum]|nr:hypothetical protein AWC11_11370 [Mycobacterium interjectum]